MRSFFCIALLSVVSALQAEQNIFVDAGYAYADLDIGNGDGFYGTVGYTFAASEVFSHSVDVEVVHADFSENNLEITPIMLDYRLSATLSSRVSAYLVAGFGRMDVKTDDTSGEDRFIGRIGAGVELKAGEAFGVQFSYSRLNAQGGKSARVDSVDLYQAGAVFYF